MFHPRTFQMPTYVVAHLLPIREAQTGGTLLERTIVKNFEYPLTSGLIGDVKIIATVPE